MCLASPGSGPPWPHLCPELNSDDGHCGVWTLDHRDGSSCQNVYQGSGLLTFQLKLNIIQSKTKTRIPILDEPDNLIISLWAFVSDKIVSAMIPPAISYLESLLMLLQLPSALNCKEYWFYDGCKIIPLLLCNLHPRVQYWIELNIDWKRQQNTSVYLES